MERTARTYSSFAEMKADEYRYWQSRPVHERMAAVAELTLSLYEMKGKSRNELRLEKVVEVRQR